MNTNHLIPSSNFVAIDVEYADMSNQNICQFGVAVVKDQQVIENRSWLIQPPGNKYDEATMRKHHITPDMTAEQPTFGQRWIEIRQYVISKELWAHNARSVEQPVIEKNLRRCGFAYDWLNIYDSRDLFERPDCPPNSGNSLELCCMAMDIPCENHHNAGADALMVAKLLIGLQQGRKPEWGGVPKSEEELRKFLQEKRILHLGEFCDFYNSDSSEGMDVFTEVTSTYEGAQPQIIDVFDKGDRISEGSTLGVDFSRLDTGDNNPLRGKKVCITGMFRYNRKDIEKAIEAMGAKRVPKPTRATNAVILGTRNVGFVKLCAIEEQEAVGHHLALIVGDTDLEALLYGDGHKFFRVNPLF